MQGALATTFRFFVAPQQWNRAMWGISRIVAGFIVGVWQAKPNVCDEKSQNDRKLLRGCLVLFGNGRNRVLDSEKLSIVGGVRFVAFGQAFGGAACGIGASRQRWRARQCLVFGVGFVV